jgi:pimeloyl-ACP methyl ester carboxylesterase/DNA-binding CsgD family transcriptional regulator
MQRRPRCSFVARSEESPLDGFVTILAGQDADIECSVLHPYPSVSATTVWLYAPDMLMQGCNRQTRTGARMHQQVRFCKSFDGVRIAYAIVGHGPPLVMSASWLTHLEHQWRCLAWKPWLEHLSRRYTLIRYDSRGCGLSDREVRDLSFDIWVRDFEAVIDAAGFSQVSLLGTCQGGPIAIEYAARHPRRVEKLLLYGSYARGLARRTEIANQADKAKVLLDMLRLGWGDESHAYLQLWASLFQPGGGIEHLRSWSDLQRLSTSAETAARLLDTTFNVDVQASAARVKCPTLLIAPERDSMVPFDEGRRLADLIPGAQFVSLDTNNHMPLPDEPAWTRLVTEMDAFLLGTSASSESQDVERFSGLTERERDVLEAIARGHDNTEIAAGLHLSEKTVRNHITRVFDKIGVRHRYEAIVIARDAGFGHQASV